MEELLYKTKIKGSPSTLGIAGLSFYDNRFQFCDCVVHILCTPGHVDRGMSCPFDQICNNIIDS